jgi:hypothetical protein
MFISIGDNMTQLDLFEDKAETVKNFVDDNSGNLTDEVIDYINERLTEIFTDEDISDYDLQVVMADELMKAIGKNLQITPEEWV